MADSLHPNPSSARTRWIGIALCAASSVGFATLSILGKFAFASGLSMSGFLGLRFCGAALLLAIYLGLTRRGGMFSVGRDLALRLFALGALGYSLQSSLFFLGLQRISASLSSILFYAYPVFVALLMWRFARRPPTRAEWLAMGLALAGVLFTVIPDLSQPDAPPVDMLGVILLLVSACGYGIYIMVSEKLVQRAGALASTAWITAGAGVTYNMVGFLLHDWRPPATPQGWGIILAMILFSTILPLATLLAGLARVGPTTAALLSTLEPVFTIALAVILLGEVVSPPQLGGGVLVIAAVILLSLHPGRPAVASVEE
jgi:drug/metabolite transporter (DMT)-like permease